MTPKTLNRYNSKWPEVKIFLSYIYSSRNVLELYFVKGFYRKSCLRQFSIKKSYQLFVVEILCIPAGWESYSI
jgi:hypothetical protein